MYAYVSQEKHVSYACHRGLPHKSGGRPQHVSSRIYANDRRSTEVHDGTAWHWDQKGWEIYFLLDSDKDV